MNQHRSYCYPDAWIELVMPAKAAQWLTQNTHNRKIRPAVVKALVDQINAGEWRLTASGIGFDSNGVLLDGQHRLSAIVESDRPAQLVVAVGLPNEGQSKVDRHSRRTIADVMRLEGCAATSKTVQCAVLILNCLRTASGQPPDYEVRAWLDDHGVAIDRFEDIVGEHNERGTGRVSYLAPFIVAIHNDASAGELLRRFLSGVGLSESDPMYHLRKRALSGLPCHGEQQRTEEMERAVYCIRAAMDDRKIMRVMRDNATREWLRR